MRRKINISLVIVLLFAFILLCSIIFIISRILDNNQEKNYYELNSDIYYKGKLYERDDKIDSYLIVGLDKYIAQMGDEAYFNDQCSDFILLLSINHTKKSVTAFQINRDTMTDVSVLGVSGNKVSTKTCQIALSHCYGNGDLVSLRNTADAVSGLVGFDVSNYMAVTMDAISEITDYVGGVPVKIEDDFTGVEDSFIMGETVTLTGAKAITFVQSRSSMVEPTNVNRMARQNQYITSLIEKMRACSDKDEDFAMNLYMKIASFITFNNSETQMNNLIKRIIDYKFEGIISFKGESKEGPEFMEFWPDNIDIDDKIVKHFYKLK